LTIITTRNAAPAPFTTLSSIKAKERIMQALGIRYVNKLSE
jgi:hypothetical protein